MNVHIKSKNNTDPLPEAYLRKIIRLIDKYDCRQYIYFMTGNDTVLQQLRESPPTSAAAAAAGTRRGTSSGALSAAAVKRCSF